MAIYLLRRIGFVVLTLFLASIIIFGATQLLPGDVAQVMLGQFATDEALANLRVELGLDRPAWVQYLDWLGGFLRGDWGESVSGRQPVRPLVLSRLRNSAQLVLLALAFYVPVGILLGVVFALKRDRALDQLITGLSMALVGLPEFVSGLLLISAFAFGLAVLPANSSIAPDTGFLRAFPHLVLPAVTVSLTSLGYVTRMTRASTIDVLSTDHVRAADLKGLPRGRVLGRHVLRDSLLPTVTVVAMGIGYLIGGLIVTEQVFGYPGLGRLLVYGVQRRDVALIQACSTVVVAVYSLSNLAANILYSVLNPRIRYR
ncbi:MAG: ABC transporter permease [Spirochaetales bacterium]|nr:ABC transporter permease [Spirochaetales bacterium]